MQCFAAVLQPMLCLTYLWTGVVIEYQAEMLMWAHAHQMPNALLQLAPPADPTGMVVRGGGEDEGLTATELRTLWAVPVKYDDYPETNAICLTGNTQLKWLGQLVASDVRYVRTTTYHIISHHMISHHTMTYQYISLHIMTYR